MIDEPGLHVLYADNLKRTHEYGQPQVLVTHATMENRRGRNNIILTLIKSSAVDIRTSAEIPVHPNYTAKA